MDLHYASIGPVLINAVGGVVNRDTASFREVSGASSELRVLEDDSIPNSAGYPTIDDYLAAEAADEFTMLEANQSMVITGSLSGGGGAPADELSILPDLLSAWPDLSVLRPD